MQEQSDEQQIRDLVAAYCHLVDHGRGDEVADRIYTVDGVDDHGIGPVRGRAALRTFFDPETLGSFLEASAHTITNQVIRINGDRARSQCYFTAWHWLRVNAHLGMRAADEVIVGVYDDTAQRTPEGWRLSERYIRRLGPSVLASGELSDTPLGAMVKGLTTKLGGDFGMVV